VKTAEAFAKVNLTLHVTGQRADGYHLLDSLVVFAAFGDRLTCEARTNGISLAVTGPFAEGVPTDDSNLVWRAAEVMRGAAEGDAGLALTLEKNLPHAAGIGSGSSDAAATLALVAAVMGAAPLHPEDPRVLTLGADVPVCLCAPRPMRMQGIGDALAPVPALPPAALVLVNPRVPVPTGAVFAALSRKDNAPMTELPAYLDFNAFAEWLGQQRNDLQPAAVGLAPQIGVALAALAGQSNVTWSGMSGSGATCVGLVRDLVQAEAAATYIRRDHPDWWVIAAPMATAH